MVQHIQCLLTAASSHWKGLSWWAHPAAPGCLHHMLLIFSLRWLLKVELSKWGNLHPFSFAGRLQLILEPVLFQWNTAWPWEETVLLKCDFFWDTPGAGRAEIPNWLGCTGGSSPTLKNHSRKAPGGSPSFSSSSPSHGIIFREGGAWWMSESHSLLANAELSGQDQFKENLERVISRAVLCSRSLIVL